MENCVLLYLVLPKIVKMVGTLCHEKKWKGQFPTSGFDAPTNLYTTSVLI